MDNVSTAAKWSGRPCLPIFVTVDAASYRTLAATHIRPNSPSRSLLAVFGKYVYLIDPHNEDAQKEIQLFDLYLRVSARKTRVPRLLYS